MSISFLSKVAFFVALFLIFSCSGCLFLYDWEKNCYDITVEILLEEELVDYDLDSFINITNTDLSECPPLVNAIDQLIVNATRTSRFDRRTYFYPSQAEWEFSLSLTNGTFIYQQYYFEISFGIC